MFARSAMSERTATLSPRWTASANRESAAKTGTASITDKLTIRSAFRLIQAPPRQSQVTDETGFRGIASRLHAAVKPAVAISSLKLPRLSCNQQPSLTQVFIE